MIEYVEILVACDLARRLGRGFISRIYSCNVSTSCFLLDLVWLILLLLLSMVSDVAAVTCIVLHIISFFYFFLRLEDEAW